MDFPTHIPFARVLGLELNKFEGGEADLALTLTPELLNSAGVAHGGVLMTVLDVAMAHAARSLYHVPSDAPAGTLPDTVTTIEMKTSFMRPGSGRLVAKGRLLTQTLTMSFCEASVHDVDGKLVAHATGTFKRMKRKPAAAG